MKKHSGRPKLPTDQAKSCVARARISKEELRKIEDAAARSGQKVSDWVRKTLLSAAK
jgi:hypothetical protein